MANFRGFKAPGRSLTLKAFNTTLNPWSHWGNLTPGVAKDPRIIFNMKVAVKFDRTVLSGGKFKRFNNDALKRAGAYMRGVAVKSIRKTQSERPSKPGKPPRSRSSRHWMRKILFDTAYTLSNRDASLIVGPIGLGSANPVTELHELGGYKRIEERTIMARSRKEALARLQGKRITKKTRSRPRGGSDRWKAMSKSQQQHIIDWYAARGKARKEAEDPVTEFKFPAKMVRYPERPYMSRALDIAWAKIPDMWKNSISGPGASGSSLSRLANMQVT